MHGSLAHARDFDDTFPDTVVHPGSTVIAAALAAGERADVGFADLTTSVVVGYEIAARLGAVAGRGFHARGFHATGIVGPIAAAAATGRILALDAAAMADALGLATSMSSGLLAFLGDGGWSKWLHTGWSAHGGLIAAQLAGQAFRGPRQALDHPYGLYGAFLGTPDANLDVLTDGLGRTWLGASAQAKLYPCAHVIQPYIDVALALRARGRVSAEDVQSLSPASWRPGPFKSSPNRATPRSRHATTSRRSPACPSWWRRRCATAGSISQRCLPTPSTARDTRAFDANRLHVRRSLGTGFDGRMEIVLRDGTSLSRSVGATPPSETRIVAKFQANLAGRPEGTSDALLNAAMETAPRSSQLMRLAAAAIAPHP